MFRYIVYVNKKTSDVKNNTYYFFSIKCGVFFILNSENKMANILDIVKNQQEQQINVNKLIELSGKKNVWDHFGLENEDFVNLSESKQMQLTSKFYFESVNNTAQQPIDSSIGSIINNSDGISHKKVYENGDNRTEMSLSTKRKDEKNPNL